MRGVPVLGTLDGLERVVEDSVERREPIVRVVLTPSALLPEAHPESIITTARRLGLATQRLPSLDEGGEALRLAPVSVEDLLLRPSVKIDYQRLESVVHGKAVVVTGGELGRLHTWYTHPNRQADHDLASPTAMCDLPQHLMERSFPVRIRDSAARLMLPYL